MLTSYCTRILTFNRTFVRTSKSNAIRLKYTLSTISARILQGSEPHREEPVLEPKSFGNIRTGTVPKPVLKPMYSSEDLFGSFGFVSVPLRVIFSLTTDIGNFSKFFFSI